VVEVVLSEEASPQIAEWLAKRLTDLGGTHGESQSGVADSVDAHWQTWSFPDGEKIEIWSDNYSALSIRGLDSRVLPIQSAFQKEFDRG
jgi:hypothetical protein